MSLNMGTHPRCLGREQKRNGREKLGNSLCFFLRTSRYDRALFRPHLECLRLEMLP